MIKIRNFLNYYYHLYPIEIIKDGMNYKFYLNDKLYILYLITNQEQKVKEQVNLNKSLVFYNYPSLIIDNIFNEFDYSIFNTLDNTGKYNLIKGGANLILSSEEKKKRFINITISNIYNCFSNWSKLCFTYKEHYRW